VPGCYIQTNFPWQCSIPAGLQLHGAKIAQGGGKVEFFCEPERENPKVGELPGRRPSTLGLGMAVVFHELGLVVTEKVLDHLYPAEAGGNAFLLLEEAVVCERFPDLHDFDVALLGFPKLAFGESRKWGRGFFLHICQTYERIVPKFIA
jgi:hypothetical protein